MPEKFPARKMKLVDKRGKIGYATNRETQKGGADMSFGSRLQALRHRHGITQEAFAQQLNVSRQAVSKWESSRGYPEIEKIIFNPTSVVK